ncbi:MAG: phenylalanine--tRNA ligase subunit alpha [Proteobacteria bacterium]|nr:phenylalanine--tRNA ligase subunit alpha [Pseudomonadota bacterium]
MQDLNKLKSKILAEIKGAKTLSTLEDIRLSALGKKGRVTALLKELGHLSAEEKKTFGGALNQLKGDINSDLNAKREELEAKALNTQLAEDKFDVTLPVEPEPEGRIHPLTQVLEEMMEIFAAMDFKIAEGPHIEDDFHNFTALNIPPEHPARQMHDTFYMKADQGGERKLLRTHTSPVQIRTMMSQKPPIRIIAPGRTFRSDSDATHTPMFHQIEGLVIDEFTTMGHLKGTIEAFVKAFFEVDDVKMRFRPSYFPFTEPSAEVDVGCDLSKGQVRIGGGNDWLEIIGCGMLHPKVLEYCNLDPNKYQGFAFGCGLDRLAMLKYGMPDLRPFFESDLRWLRHYGFRALDIPTIAGGLSR